MSSTTGRTLSLSRYYTRLHDAQKGACATSAASGGGLNEES